MTWRPSSAVWPAKVTSASSINTKKMKGATKRFSGRQKPGCDDDGTASWQARGTASID